MYITNANLRKISKYINYISLKEEAFKQLYKKDLSFCFSNAELTELVKLKTFFEDPEKQIMLFRKVNVFDKKTFIFEGKAPSYHPNEKCKNLYSEWHDYYLPEKIKWSDDKTIERFRNFIKDYLRRPGTLIIDDELDRELQKEFNVHAKFKDIRMDNTSSKDFEHELERETLEYVQYASEKIYDDLKNFSSLSNVHKTIFEWRYADSWKIKKFSESLLPQDKKIAEEFNQLKYKLTMSLLVIYKKMSNYNGLDEDILIDLNFKACYVCFKEGFFETNNPRRHF